MAIFYEFYGFFYSATYKLIGKNTINDDKFLSIIGATSLLVSGSCKFVLTYLLDFA